MLKREILEKQQRQIEEAMEKAFSKMLESSSDEDIKKYENLCSQSERVKAQLEEAIAIEEKNLSPSTPDNLREKSNSQSLDEKVKFVQSLRESVTKGATFTGLIPREVADQIERKKSEISTLRGYCTVHQATGDYTIYVEGDDATVAYVSEGNALTETSPSIKPLPLSALKLGCLVKVSSEYLEDLAVDVMGFLVDKISKAFAIKEDHEILFGAGTSASKTNIRGIDANTSVTAITAASESAFTWEEVKQVVQALGSYRENAILVMNATTLDAIHSFKDGSEYIFDQNSEIKQIMGKKVVLCKDMPTPATGKTVIIAGDFSYYHLLDRKKLEIKTLNELYAANDMVGITAIERIDGDLTFPEAFSKLVMA